MSKSELYEMTRQIRGCQRTPTDLFACSGTFLPLFRSELFSREEIERNLLETHQLWERTARLLGVYGERRTNRFDLAVGILLRRAGMANLSSSYLDKSRIRHLSMNLVDGLTNNDGVNHPLPVRITSRGGTTPFEAKTIELEIPELSTCQLRGFLRFSIGKNSSRAELRGWTSLPGIGYPNLIRTANPTDIREFGEIIDMVEEQIEPKYPRGGRRIRRLEFKVSPNL